MLKRFLSDKSVFPLDYNTPWEITSRLCEIINQLMQNLDDNYTIDNGVAVHKTATIGHNVTIKAPAILSANSFVGSNSYLRGGIFLGPGAKVGISCEIKTSVLLEGCAVAHFNFVGDSIIGHNVNIEAGAILANHYNERDDDTVFVHWEGERIPTGLHKFGSLVGDKCRIGANAVLSPGTLLPPQTIVNRLQLIEQDPL
jgi:NDP-sugar pyrophosphorylase family protein